MESFAEARTQTRTGGVPRKTPPPTSQKTGLCPTGGRALRHSDRAPQGRVLRPACYCDCACCCTADSSAESRTEEQPPPPSRATSGPLSRRRGGLLVTCGAVPCQARKGQHRIQMGWGGGDVSGPCDERDVCSRASESNDSAHGEGGGGAGGKPDSTARFQRGSTGI